MYTVLRLIRLGKRFAFTAITVATICLSLPWARAVSNVWINEIHYDNSGTDVGEGIEVAGAAGIDLSGFQLVFYNGSGGTVYKTENLTGSIPNLQNGFGVVQFFVSGLQNGAPDGVALYDNAHGEVVQFLSYEGSFQAADGPAIGLSSTDVGMFEDGLNGVDTSLQLIGLGSEYSDFAWTGPSAASPGVINVGQAFSGGATSSVPDGGGATTLLSVALLGLFAVGRGRGGGLR